MRFAVRSTVTARCIMFIEVEKVIVVAVMCARAFAHKHRHVQTCLLYTSPSPRDA